MRLLSDTGFDEEIDEDYSLFNMDTEHYTDIGEDSYEIKMPTIYPHRRKTVVNWNNKTAFVDSIYELCDNYNINYEDFDMSVIRDTTDLSSLSQEHFKSISREHGTFLYERMQRKYPQKLSSNYLPEQLQDIRSYSPVSPVPLKRAPGRPRTSNKIRHKSEKKTGKVWEFLLRLLKDPSKDDMISWENRKEGMFKFVSTEKVAKLWGKMRGNEQMNYEKLSRAMRYYYKSQILCPVLGKRLIYRFGPNASGWRQENEDEDAENKF